MLVKIANRQSAPHEDQPWSPLMSFQISQYRSRWLCRSLSLWTWDASWVERHLGGHVSPAASSDKPHAWACGASWHLAGGTDNGGRNEYSKSILQYRLIGQGCKGLDSSRIVHTSSSSADTVRAARRQVVGWECISRIKTNRFKTSFFS